MQVSNPNNIKIYNLSAGKSLPEWLTDRKKRSLQKDDIDIRRRIELIQDFDMPTVSNCINVTKNGRYILATGVYKPRVRCYDVNQLSMKFERCMDSEVVKMFTLEEDYSKIVFLQADRYLEFHAQEGRYYRTRIPKYGRDMSYHEPSCDLYIVGMSTDIYRFNLEQGRFMSSLKTDSGELNCCEFNPVHQLFAVGTNQGTVECWDPRSRIRAGILDCAIAALGEDTGIQGIPSVTALKFKDGLQMAAGTKSGQVILYDIRSNKPLLVKDHMYGEEIKAIQYHDDPDLVISCDTRIVKLWHRNTGKPYTSIEPGSNLNSMCILPESGLIFLAHEAPKMLTYYIPNLGTAPKWCSFLDSLTEELEENPTLTVYDDYKFVTRNELDGLGLTHLIGSSLLRAYMHGFFIDIRLYNKARTISQPFAYDEYRKTKIQEKIDEKRQNRIQKVKKLPMVNKLLAEKLRDEESGVVSNNKKKQKMAESLLVDNRFSKLFQNTEFQIDPESEEYKLINPLVSKLEKDRRRRLRNENDGDSSSDDEHTWTDEVKKQHKLIRQKEKAEKMHQKLEELANIGTKSKYIELKQGVKLSDQVKHKKLTKKSLGDRLLNGEETGEIQQRQSILGNMQMTFAQKKKQKNDEKDKLHLIERKKVRRSAQQLPRKKLK